MKYKTTLYINRPILKVLRNFHPFKNTGKKSIDGLGSFYIYEYTGPSFDTEEIIDLMAMINDYQYYCPFISINRPVR